MTIEQRVFEQQVGGFSEHFGRSHRRHREARARSSSTRRISATDSSLVTNPCGIFASQSANKSTSSWPSARKSSGSISIGAVLFFNVSSSVFIAIYTPRSASGRILTAQSFEEIRFTRATAIHQTEHAIKLLCSPDRLVVLVG